MIGKLKWVMEISNLSKYFKRFKNWLKKKKDCCFLTTEKSLSTPIGILTYFDFIGPKHFYCYNLLFSLVLDKNGVPEKILPEGNKGIKLVFLDNKPKCPTRDLFIYKCGDEWQATTCDNLVIPNPKHNNNIILPKDYTRFRFRMLSENYYWTLIEVINLDIPNKFRGYRDQIKNR